MNPRTEQPNERCGLSLGWQRWAAWREPAVRRNRGVTLIELMIVLVIMAVVVLASLPSILQANNERAMADASRELASVMRTARMRAVSYNIATGIQVNGATHQVNMLVSPDNNCANLGNSTTVIDYNTTDVLIDLNSANDQVICIRPNGQIATATGGIWTTAMGADDNGALSFSLMHRDNEHLRSRIVVLPFNGLSRIGN